VTHDVVVLGAWCDFVPERQALASRGSVSIDVREFAVLGDGRRITLHTDRGFAVSGPRRPTPSDPLAGMTAAEIELHARTTVLPDEDDPADDHPYERLADLLHQHGVVATPGSLRAVPYTVEFSDRLRRLLDGR
jgi:hypothetical protein